MKLKQYFSEVFEQPIEQTPQQPQAGRYNQMDKKTFLESCKAFSQHGASIYRAKDLKERVEQIRNLVETAEQLTLQETENWMDTATVNRHMKQLKESYKMFEKTSGEIMGLQQRLESCYEDIGKVLSTYYTIR